jgi:sensor histidine kinase YesM
MRVRRLFSGIGIFGKITLSVCVIVALVLFAAASLSIGRFTGILLDKERVITGQAVQKLTEFMTEKYNLVYNQTTLMNSSNHVSDILARCEEDPSLYHNFANVKFIMDYLYAVCFSDEKILDVILVTPDNTYSYSKSNRHKGAVLTSYDFTSLGFIGSLKNSSRNIMAFYDPAPPYVAGSKEPVISLAGKLYNPKAFPQKQLAAYVIINYAAGVFGEIYHQLEPSEQVGYLIANSEGDVIYSSAPAYLGGNLKTLGFPADAQLIKSSVGISGIQIIAVFSENAIRAAANRQIGMMIPIYAASAVMILAVILLFYRIYKKRVFAITGRMLSIGSGDLSDRLPVTSNDEIGKLSAAFNQMCAALDTYIKLNYKAEIARRQAQVNALQAQINPHFLFNTIESIRMQAMLRSDADVAEMLAKLGNMFRWMMQYDERFVYLEDEIEYVTSYLCLQQVRFQDRIDIDLDVADNLMYLGLPKFTLQPVVENALMHGLGQGRRLRLALGARAEDGRLILSVKDDGPGIDPERLKRLLAHIEGDAPDGEFGIGLRNVHQRLKMLFGDAYGLIIESPPRGGTAVTIALPALGKKEMEKHVPFDRG